MSPRMANCVEMVYFRVLTRFLWEKAGTSTQLLLILVFGFMRYFRGRYITSSTTSRVMDMLSIFAMAH